jgi:tetratricopeptide (TPR) repeat protein
MATSKFAMNLLFTCLTVLLALTAFISIYRHTALIDHQPTIGMESSSATQAISPAKANQLAELERLVTEHPENAEYQTQLANSYYDAGQYEKAAAHYQAFLKTHPQNPNVETDLATCYHYLGKNDQALELLNNVLKSNPDFSQAKFNKGIVLINGMKEIEKGISVWKELLASDPNFSQKEDLAQRIRRLEESNR